MSAIDMPAADSISVSASTKTMFRRAASRRPIEDLPAPIMPTSTIERRPSAAASATASEVTPGAGVNAKSAIEPSFGKRPHGPTNGRRKQRPMPAGGFVEREPDRRELLAF